MVVNMDSEPSEAADTVKREVKLQLNVTMMIMIIDHTKDNIDDDEYDDDDEERYHLQWSGAAVPPAHPLVTTHLARPKILVSSSCS